MRLSLMPSAAQPASAPAAASVSVSVSASASASPSSQASRRAAAGGSTTTSTSTSAAAFAVLALISVLALASAPLAAAESHAVAHHHHQQQQAGLGSNNGHNQVHAAHIKHAASSQAASSSQASSRLPVAAAASSSSAHKSKSKSKAAAAAAGAAGAESPADEMAGSNKLGAAVRTGSGGLSTVYSVDSRATELVGSGVDTLYTSNSTACSRHYTVTATDTCDIIGHKTHTSTYQIMALNIDKTGPDCYFLEAGMRLCLGRFGSDCQLVHQVRNSESCTDILRRYDISRQVLLENNPNLDCRNIYDGLNLCVAPGRIAPPEPAGMYVARRSIEA